MLGYLVSAVVGMAGGAAGVTEAGASDGVPAPVPTAPAAPAPPARPETGFDCKGWGPQTTVLPSLVCELELIPETSSLSVRNCRLSVSPGLDKPNESVELRWTGATERAVIFESRDKVTQVVVATGGEHIGKARIKARSGYYRCSSSYTIAPLR